MLLLRAIHIGKHVLLLKQYASAKSTSRAVMICLLHQRWVCVCPHPMCCSTLRGVGLHSCLQSGRTQLRPFRISSAAADPGLNNWLTRLVSLDYCDVAAGMHAKLLQLAADLDDI